MNFNQNVAVRGWNSFKACWMWIILKMGQEDEDEEEEEGGGRIPVCQEPLLCLQYLSSQRRRTDAPA